MIDLVGLPHDADAVTRVRIITQVARTVIGLSSTRRTWLRSAGKPWDLWRLDGEIVDRPIDYETLLGFYGICEAKPGMEAVSGDCFTVLP